jgi:hypothetical protein
MLELEASGVQFRGPCGDAIAAQTSRKLELNSVAGFCLRCIPESAYAIGPWVAA